VTLSSDAVKIHFEAPCYHHLQDELTWIPYYDLGHVPDQTQSPIIPCLWWLTFQGLWCNCDWQRNTNV